jgi:hypothetical protein
MAIFEQLPGTLDVYCTVGDEVPLALDFGRNITGYTLTSAVYVYAQTVPTSGGVAVPQAGVTVFTPTLTVVDATLGKIMVGASEAQTSLLSPLGNYRWYVRWVANGVTRTVVSGIFKVSNP